jgi:hypothetical protein
MFYLYVLGLLGRIRMGLDLKIRNYTELYIYKSVYNRW